MERTKRLKEPVYMPMVMHACFFQFWQLSLIPGFHPCAFHVHTEEWKGLPR